MIEKYKTSMLKSNKQTITNPKKTYKIYYEKKKYIKIEQASNNFVKEGWWKM